MRSALTVTNLGKTYRLGASRAAYQTLREALAAKARRALRFEGPAGTPEEFWALRDVTFQLYEGDQLAIIGRNGAGKSTLLKLLSRITEPTAGEICMHGRVASLLEVGTGFHPELSGRENIYLNAAILGMSRREIRGKFDAIVDFADVERFLDTPVKRYSSGMYVRLAFSVAAHLDPDILIIDEVLAVGDRQFQDKCLRRMEAMSADEGRTILFVSHNLDAVRRFCKKGIVLSQGRLAYEGDVNGAIASYLRASSDASSRANLEVTQDRWGTGQVRLANFDVLRAGASVETLASGEDHEFVIGYVNKDRGDIAEGVASLALANDRHVTVLLVSTQFSRTDIVFRHGEGHIRCTIRDLSLAPGDYTVTLFLGAKDGRTFDCLNDIARLTVAGGDYFGTNHPGLPEHCSTLTRATWTST